MFVPDSHEQHTRGTALRVSVGRSWPRESVGESHELAFCASEQRTALASPNRARSANQAKAKAKKNRARREGRRRGRKQERKARQQGRREEKRRERRGGAASSRHSPPCLASAQKRADGAAGKNGCEHACPKRAGTGLDADGINHTVARPSLLLSFLPSRLCPLWCVAPAGAPPTKLGHVVVLPASGGPQPAMCEVPVAASSAAASLSVFILAAPASTSHGLLILDRRVDWESGAPREGRREIRSARVRGLGARIRKNAASLVLVLTCWPSSL
jgi:hypothetical protein